MYSVPLHNSVFLSPLGILSLNIQKHKNGNIPQKICHRMLQQVLDTKVGKIFLNICTVKPVNKGHPLDGLYSEVAFNTDWTVYQNRLRKWII